MSLIKKYAGSTNRARVEEGTHAARIAQIIDIGRQSGEYEGKPYNKPTLWVTFEFPTELAEFNGEQKPLWLSGEFTKSTNEKSKLYKIINACDPDVEEFEDLLGKACLVEVGTTSGGNAKFVSAMGLPKGMTVDKLANPTLFYDIEKPNVDVFNTFPDFLKEKMMGSDDWVEPNARGTSQKACSDSDIPF